MAIDRRAYEAPQPQPTTKREVVQMLRKVRTGKRLGSIVTAAIITCALVGPAPAFAQVDVPPTQADAQSVQSQSAAIRQIDINDVTVEFDQRSYAYTGSHVTPDPYVYVDAWTWYQYYGVYGDNGPEEYDSAEDLYHGHDFTNDPNFSFVDAYGWIHPLKEGTDYYLSYENNVNPGTAYVDLHGKGDNFFGDTSVAFTITGDPQPTPVTTKAVRLAGSTRYGTMTSIVNATFSQPGDGVAILASGNAFPDALSAAALAGIHRAPILLTQPNALSPEVTDQLSRLNIRKVYIMGGMNAISENVENTLNNMGYETYRINGADRAETSIKAFDIAEMDGAQGDTIIVATGNNFADSLSISPYAYQTATPIVLTAPNGSLSDGTLALLVSKTNIKRAIIVGGTNAVSANVEKQLAPFGITAQRLQGANRYETSLAIANWECSNGGFNWVEPVVTTGTAFPDALTGSQFAGITGRVVLLANNTSDVTVKAIGQHKQDVGARYYVLGGSNAVSDGLVRYIDSIIL